MLLKEEEARTKWCPFARSVAADKNNQILSFVSLNRINRQGGKANLPEWPTAACCIASNCMAWRWISEAVRDEEGASVLGKGNIVLTEKVRGRCGLAGV